MRCWPTSAARSSISSSEPLANRVTIERAIGVMMATYSLDAVEAFNVLRQRARSQRRRVAEIAAEVLSDRRFAPRGGIAAG